MPHPALRPIWQQDPLSLLKPPLHQNCRLTCNHLPPRRRFRRQGPFLRAQSPCQKLPLDLTRHLVAVGKLLWVACYELVCFWLLGFGCSGLVARVWLLGFGCSGLVATSGSLFCCYESIGLGCSCCCGLVVVLWPLWASCCVSLGGRYESL